MCPSIIYVQISAKHSMFGLSVHYLQNRISLKYYKSIRKYFRNDTQYQVDMDELLHDHMQLHMNRFGETL